MKQIIKIIRKAFLSTEKIPAELANEKLKDFFFKRAKGSGSIHKVVNGCPLYYNDELKKWKVSSLAFVWGHENEFIDVVKISEDKIPNHIKFANIDWLT